MVRGELGRGVGINRICWEPPATAPSADRGCRPPETALPKSALKAGRGTGNNSGEKSISLEIPFPCKTKCKRFIKVLLSGKESACQCRSCRFDLGSGRSPWRRKWPPTPVFSHEKSHGLRSLVGYGPWRVEQDSETKQQLLPLVVIHILQEGLRGLVEI